MVLDSSAVLAILRNEPEAELYETLIAADPVRLLSAVSLVECSIELENRFGDAGSREFDLWVHKTKIQIREVDAEQADAARHAFSVYGKGRHQAALNFADCFSYALSKVTGEPLLYKGEEFAWTGIAPALK